MPPKIEINCKINFFPFRVTPLSSRRGVMAVRMDPLHRVSVGAKRREIDRFLRLHLLCLADSPPQIYS